MPTKKATLVRSLQKISKSGQPKATLTSSFQKVDKTGKPVGKPVVGSTKEMKTKPITAQQFNQKKYGGTVGKSKKK